MIAWLSSTVAFAQEMPSQNSEQKTEKENPTQDHDQDQEPADKKSVDKNKINSETDAAHSNTNQAEKQHHK